MRKNGSNNGNPFLQTCLRIQLCNHQLVIVTKLLKSLYPTVQYTVGQSYCGEPPQVHAGLLVCQALYRSVEKVCRDPDNLYWLASSVAESLICTPDQEDMNTNLGGTEIGKAILVRVTIIIDLLHFCNWRQKLSLNETFAHFFLHVVDFRTLYNFCL